MCVVDGRSDVFASQKGGILRWRHIARLKSVIAARALTNLPRVTSDCVPSLELGGADALDNLWPQCVPPDVALAQRNFKQQDVVEHFSGERGERDRLDLSRPLA